MMKGEKVENLYKLLGDIIQGGAVAVTHTEFSNENTNLWHMRLGHLSKRGLNELHKRNLLNGVKGCKLDFCKICVMGKQRRVSFSTRPTPVREFLTMFILMCGDLLQLHHIEVPSISSVSSMIILERSGCTS